MVNHLPRSMHAAACLVFTKPKLYPAPVFRYKIDLEGLVSLCKRRGFVFPSGEVPCSVDICDHEPRVKSEWFPWDLLETGSQTVLMDVASLSHLTDFGIFHEGCGPSGPSGPSGLRAKWAKGQVGGGAACTMCTMCTMCTVNGDRWQSGSDQSGVW
jgi:hypothetical protein